MKVLYCYIVELAGKELRTTFRYKLEFVGGILFLSAVILAIYYGLSGAAPGTFQVTGANSLLIGFLLMMLVNGTFAYPATISSDAINEGNLEFMMLFPLRFDVYLVTQALIKIYVSLITFIAVLFATAMIIADLSVLNLKLAFVLLLLLPASFSGMGVGLMLAGLVLKYKRIGSVSSMITFLVAFLLSYSPAVASPWIELLPMKAYSSLMKNMLIYNKPMDISMVGNILISSMGFYVAGIAIFRGLLLSAKKKGNLKNY